MRSGEKRQNASQIEWKTWTSTPAVSMSRKNADARRLAADRVVQDAHLHAGPGLFLEGHGDGVTEGVVTEDIGFQPDARPGGGDVAQHLREEGGRLDVKR